MNRFEIKKIIGWLLFLAFALTIAFFNSLAVEIGLAGAIITLYIASIAIFLNAGFDAVKGWGSFRHIDYKTCIVKIYETSTPSFLFFGNIYKCGHKEHLIGEAALAYFLIPLATYGKIMYPESFAQRLPLVLLVAFGVHLQISFAFELIVLIAKKRSR